MAHFHGWVGARKLNTLCTRFKGHSLGGSSIASLYVRNAQSRLRMPGGLHVGFWPAF